MEWWNNGFLFEKKFHFFTIIPLFYQNMNWMAKSKTIKRFS